MYDILIVGGGPAGLSAAVAARQKGKTVLVLSNPQQQNPLWKAEQIDNYLGLPGKTGAELLEAFQTHAEQMGAEVQLGKVLSVVPMKKSWFLTVGSSVIEGRKLILTTGVSRGVKYPGEAAYLGKGVSYCATCDGMLYRKKPVIVVGRSKDAPLEANYLADIGCQVTYVSPQPPKGLEERIPYVKANRLEIEGDATVTALVADGARLPCTGIFLLRESVAPTDLLPMMETENGYIRVNRRMETNLSGVYAAGDCTGKPLQVSKAVGEGLIAAEAASDAIEAEQNGKEGN